MIIFKVSDKRIYREFQEHVQGDMKRVPEWFVDETGVFHLYILTDFQYGYYFSCPKDQIPTIVRTMVSSTGETFGVLKDEPVEVVESIDVYDRLRQDNPGQFFASH